MQVSAAFVRSTSQDDGFKVIGSKAHAHTERPKANLLCLPTYVFLLGNRGRHLAHYLACTAPAELTETVQQVLTRLDSTHDLALESGGRYPGLYRLLAHPSPTLRALVGSATACRWWQRRLGGVQHRQHCADVQDWGL